MDENNLAREEVERILSMNPLVFDAEDFENYLQQQSLELEQWYQNRKMSEITRISDTDRKDVEAVMEEMFDKETMEHVGIRSEHPTSFKIFRLITAYQKILEKK